MRFQTHHLVCRWLACRYLVRVARWLEWVLLGAPPLVGVSHNTGALGFTSG
jgi:hypothetical protein